MDSDSPLRVSPVGLLVAFAIPLAVVALSVVVLAQAGPHQVLLAGVPREHLQSLHVAPESEATVTREQAIAEAREALPGATDGGQETAVRQVALGRYSNEPGVTDTSRGRLVWIVSFANPDEVGRGYSGGGVDRDRSCDWAFHVDFVIYEIDAQTGDYISWTEGGKIDPSRPPRDKTFQVTPDERARCERVVSEWERAARSP